jgi:hypothetical protein
VEAPTLPVLTQRRHYAYPGGRSLWYDDLLVSFKTEGLFDRREDSLVHCHESGLAAK